MKGKRKQIYKMTNQQQAIEEGQETEQILKRTTGVKPFHLSKVRMQRKQSEEIISRKAISEALAQKFALTKTGNSDNQDVYLDLIIKKKLLIEGQKNVKLQSQRKNLVYLGTQQKKQPEITKADHQVLNTEEARLNNVNQAFKAEECDQKQSKQSLHKRAKSNCDCCHQIHGYSRQAVICKANEFNKFNHSQRSNSETSFQKDKIDPKAQLQNILQKTSKSPFSFTNAKWRSKSQLMVVDKWKQKYDNHNEKLNPPIKKQKSAPKILINELQMQYDLSGSKRQSRSKNLKQKLTFPAIAKLSQFETPIKTSQILSQGQLFQEKKVSKKKQIKTQREEIKLIPQILTTKTISNQTQLIKESKIVIKEMYSKDHAPQPLPIQSKLNTKSDKDSPKEKQESFLAIIKQEKHKNKKTKALRSKFPQIRVSTFYSVKQNDDEKKKTKLANLQKMVNPPRYRPPKKVYFEKSLQQIPERWEYGESREESREQVRKYISIKKQEEENELLAIQQQQKKRLSELAQIAEKQKLQEMQRIQQIQQTLINKGNHNV